MRLSDREKEIIRLIDLQVNELRYRQASPDLLVSALIDFVPEAKCIINSACEKELFLYCREYRNFTYFLKLIH